MIGSKMRKPFERFTLFGKEYVWVPVDGKLTLYRASDYDDHQIAKITTDLDSQDA